MAINIDINGKPLKDFNEELNKTKKNLEDINGERLENLNSGLDETSETIDRVNTSTKNLKTQLREMTQELQGLEPGSERFNELATRAGRLRDVIADTNAVIKATAGSSVENLGNGLAGVAQIGISGFQGIASAQALFGVESEKLQQTLVKLQALAGLSDAIQSLGGLKDTITNVKAAFSAFGTSAKAALTGIKGAIAATGIGLLLIALGAAVVYWEDIKELVSGVSAEQKKLVADTKKDVELQKEKLTKLNNQDNVLKLQGKSEREILGLKIKQTQEVINSSIRQLEAQKRLDDAQVKAEARNREILNGILQFINTPLRLLLKTIDDVAKFVGVDSKLAKGFDSLLDKGAGLIFDPAEVKKKSIETQKELQAGIDELKNQKAGFELEIKNIDKQATTDAVNAQNERGKELKKQRDEQNKQTQEDIKAAKETQRQIELDYLNTIDALIEENYRAGLSKKDREIRDVNDKYFALEEAARGNAEQEKIIAESKARDLKAIDDFYINEKKVADEKVADEKKKSEEKAAEDRKKQNEQEIADAKRAQEIKVQLATDTFNAINNLSDIFQEISFRKLEKGSAEEEKQARIRFKINKAFQLGAAIVDGAKAVTTSLAASPLAYGPVPNPVGIASLASVLTNSALTIAKIASTQFQSSGGGSGGGSVGSIGGGSVGSSTSTSPKTNLFGSANQGSTTGATGTSTTSQNINVNASISVEEITNTQSRMTKLKELGSL